MKKKIALILSIVMVLCLFSGCTSTREENSSDPENTVSQGPGSDDSTVYNITFCVSASASDDRVTTVAEGIARWLYHESDGRLVVTVVPGAGAVASYADIYDGVASGLIEMGIQSSSKLTNYFPLMDVVTVPNSIGTPGCLQMGMVASKLYENHPEIQAEFDDVVVLGFNSVCNTQLYSTKPIASVDDLKGKLIRAGGEYPVAAVQALGASPVTLDMNEWADGAVKGLYDVQVLSPDAIFSFGMNGLFDYALDVSIQTSYMILCMNKDFYNSLPADLQALFTWENFMQTTYVYGGRGDVINSEYMDEVEQDMLDRGLDGIVELSVEGRAAFDEALAPVKDMWLEKATELVGAETAQAILDDFEALVDEYADYEVDWEPILDEWLSYPKVNS